MKVLLIDVHFKHSSTGKIVHDLYQGIRDNEHQAAVCYGRGPVESGDGVYKFGLDIETYFHAFMTRLTGLTGCYSPISTYRLIKYIKNYKPDVVHIHELHAYFVNLKPIINYLKNHNIKTVWTFHCEFMYTGKCGHANECEKWKTQCHHCPQVRVYPKSWVFDFTRKMYRDKKKLLVDFKNLIIITPSQWLADRVKQSFLSENEIHVIHNGIDTENIFYPRDFRHLKEKHHLIDEKVVLAVAPDLMSKQKGGRWVVELAKKFKGQNVKFILIGVKDLKEKFDDNIIALGRTSNQVELAEYYSMADIVVLTSERETYSLVCAESLSCGTPVLGFKSGAPEQISLQDYSEFVEYGDLPTLKIMLQKMFLADYYDDYEISHLAIEEYSILKMLNRYLIIYESSGSD